MKKTVLSIVKSVEPDVKVLELTEKEKNNKVIFDVIRLIIGIILSILGMFVFKNEISKIFIILGYFILLFRTISNSIKLLYKSKTINENFLVTISCIGAYFTNNVHTHCFEEVFKIPENLRKSEVDSIQSENKPPWYYNLDR